MSIPKIMEELLHRTYVDIDGGQFEGDFGFKDIFFSFDTLTAEYASYLQSWDITLKISHLNIEPSITLK